MKTIQFPSKSLEFTQRLSNLHSYVRNFDKNCHTQYFVPLFFSENVIFIVKDGIIMGVEIITSFSESILYVWMVK